MEPMLRSPLCSIQIRSRRGSSMPEKKKTAAAAPAVEAPAAEAKETKETKTRKSAKAPARRGRPPLAPELYVEFSGKQYNVTDIIDRQGRLPSYPQGWRAVLQGIRQARGRRCLLRDQQSLRQAGAVTFPVFFSPAAKHSAPVLRQVVRSHTRLHFKP